MFCFVFFWHFDALGLLEPKGNVDFCVKSENPDCVCASGSNLPSVGCASTISPVFKLLQSYADWPQGTPPSEGPLRSSRSGCTYRARATQARGLTLIVSFPATSPARPSSQTPLPGPGQRPRLCFQLCCTLALCREGTLCPPPCSSSVPSGTWAPC